MKILNIIYYKVALILNCIRLTPHYLLFKRHESKDIIRYEVERWLVINNMHFNHEKGFIMLMINFPEFRNLFYFRIGDNISKYIEFLCPKMNTLFINGNIGKGLFIQHGFATIIAANSIGENCWINQQVTIGFSNATDCPSLGNNVTISSGCKIIGKVKIGDNSKVGANAVVVKDVPENCTVVGVPAYIIKKNGQKVNIKI